MKKSTSLDNNTSIENMLKNCFFAVKDEQSIYIGPTKNSNLGVFFKHIIEASQKESSSFEHILNLFNNYLDSGSTYQFNYLLKDKDQAKVFEKVLKIKALEAHRFVPVIENCKYISPANLGFIRQIKIIKDGPTIQEHVLLDPKSNSVLFIEEWSETNKNRTPGSFVAFNSVVEKNEKWYFTGIYLSPTQPENLKEVENRKAMFSKTYQNMISFINQSDVDKTYNESVQTILMLQPSKCSFG